MKLLLLAGKAGSGKDTAAKMLTDTFPAVSLAMADPLKELAQAAFGFTDMQLWGPSEMRNAPDERFAPRNVSDAPNVWTVAEDVICGSIGMGWLREVGAVVPGLNYERAHIKLCSWFYGLKETITPRYVLQTLGTEFGRSVLGESVWVDLAILRGLVQVEQAGKMFAIITDGRFANEVARVRARQGCAIQIVNPAQTEAAFSSHASERGLDGVEFDAVIPNDKSLGFDELHRRLCAAILFLKGT